MNAKIQIKNDSIYNIGGFFNVLTISEKVISTKQTDKSLGIRSKLIIINHSEIVEFLMKFL